MTQTIINIGNSAGVILPKEVLEKLGIKKGSKVEIEVIDDEKINISPTGTKKTKPHISPELLAWLDSFNARYKNALQELAGK